MHVTEIELKHKDRPGKMPVYSKVCVLIRSSSTYIDSLANIY